MNTEPLYNAPSTYFLFILLFFCELKINLVFEYSHANSMLNSTHRICILTKKEEKKIFLLNVGLCFYEEEEKNIVATAGEVIPIQRKMHV